MSLSLREEAKQPGDCFGGSASPRNDIKFVTY